MVLTNTFLNGVIADIKTSIINDFTYIGFGTATSTPAVGDTALGAEVLRVARQDYSTSAISITVSGYASAVQGNGNTIAETGIFDAASSGNLMTRNKFSTPIAKTSDKEVWVDTTITINVSQ